MAIATAIQRGDYIYVYDERAHQLFWKPSGSGPQDGLLGYTAGSITIRQGDNIYVYDQRGYQLSSVPAR